MLDHFLLSGTLFQNCLEQTSVLHDVENLSDHEPILLELSVNVQLLGGIDRVYFPSISWIKADAIALDKYRSALSQNLDDLNLPLEALSCDDMKCQKSKHVTEIAQFCEALTESAVSAANSAIPFARSGDSKEPGGCMPVGMNL